MRWVIPLACVLFVGCRSAAGWQQVEPPFRAALEEQEYSKVEMLVADSTVVLQGPFLAGDSVKGKTSSYYQKAVPVDHIQEMEGVPRQSTVAGFAIVFGMIGVAVLSIVGANALFGDWE